MTTAPPPLAVNWLTDLLHSPGFLVIQGWVMVTDPESARGSLDPTAPDQPCLRLESASGGVIWYPQIFAGDCVGLFGHDAVTLQTCPHLWLEQIHGDDRPTLGHNLCEDSAPFLLRVKQFQSGDRWLSVHTTRHSQGEKFWVILWAMVLPDGRATADHRKTTLAPDGIGSPSDSAIVAAPVAATVTDPVADLFQGIQLQAQQYRILFEQNPNPMWVQDWESYRFLSVNKAAIDLYGYPREEFLDLSLQDLHDPEEWASLVAQLPQLANHSHYPTTQRAWQQRRRDGLIIAVELAVYQVQWDRRSVALVLARDITAKLQAETALWKSHQRYEELVNSIDGIVWEFDLQTCRFTFVSHQAQVLLGYAVIQWLEEDNFWMNHIHPDDQDWVFSLCRMKVSNFQRRDIEYRMITAQGNVLWVRDIIKVVEAEGKPWKLRGVMVNVTEQKESYGMLRQYEKIVSSTNDGIALLDCNYIYRVVNQAYLKRLNKHYSDIVGHSVDEILGNSTQFKVIKQNLDRCLAGETVQYETWLEYPCPGHYFLSVTYTPYRDLKGNVANIIASIRDLTALKQAEIAFIEQADRERFLLSMMKRIRTSLSLDSILDTTVVEVQQLLYCDRVLVYACLDQAEGIVPLEEDGFKISTPLCSALTFQSRFVAEAVAEGWGALLDNETDDPVLNKLGAKQVSNGTKILNISDIDQAKLDSVHRDFLDRYHVRAKLALPIITHSNHLWGFLAG
ncbi:PAS domain S-box protein [Prochlorothrix hollandica]|uniref:PAS domain S-box protein n=1 Tax=Prochlorothrix hollandica TaxID=1223 RepID=UPI003340341C